MKAVILLRIASILALIHGVMHTLGGVFGKPLPGPMTDAVNAMKSYRFDAMGASRTFWDFHTGEGLAITVNFAVQTAMFWLLAGLVKTDPAKARPMIAVFALNYILAVFLAWKYFFAAAAVTEIIIAVVLAAAFFLAKPAA